MPHLILEYSANAAVDVDCADIFQHLHDALMAFESFPRAGIKSRAVRHTSYLVGDGSPQNAFVHLTLLLLGGRDISVRQRITESCLQLLCAHFAPPSLPGEGPKVQITVELREMDRATYGKYPPESPPPDV